MKKTGVFIFITSLVSIFFNDIDVVNYIILLISGMMTMFSTRNVPIENNISKYVILLMFWVSVVMMPTFHLVVSKKILITQESLNNVIEFGTGVFFVTAICFFVTGLINKKGRQTVQNYSPQKISQLYIYFFLIFLYFLTAFCYSIGLGRMGMDAVVLPFHLSGIINFFRNTFAPLAFAIIAENYILRKERIPWKFVVLYSGWVVLEIIAWMSKGILISYFLPLGVLLYLYYRPPMSKIVKYASPFMVAFLLLYPIIGAVRTLDNSQSFTQNFINVIEDDKNEQEGNAFLDPLNRAFMTASQYCLDYNVVSSKDLFDFSKARAIFLFGGAARYQTFIIEGYPEWAVHSSGTTGLMDPLLHGGRGLVYVVIIILFIFAYFFDKTYSTRKYLVYYILFSIILGLSQNSNVTTLYSTLGLQRLFVLGVCILLVCKFNYKKSLRN